MIKEVRNFGRKIRLTPMRGNLPLSAGRRESSDYEIDTRSCLPQAGSQE